MAPSLAELIAIEPLGPGKYQSKHFPPHGGNSAPIAYGGFTIAVALQAAMASVPATFHLYSVMGNYLAPVSTKRRIICTVQETRSTRTFMTRRVQVSQEQDNGKPTYICLDMLADFQIAEPALITYSTPPQREYTHWKDCVTVETHRQQMLAAGEITPAQDKIYEAIFGGLHTFQYEVRACPESMTTQTLVGVNKHRPTTQDRLSLVDRSSGDWFRAIGDFKTPADHLAALTFIMDGLLSFLPLVHSRHFFDEVDACSSLDFAFRIFNPNVNLNNWHLRECITHAGGFGRTYTEGRVWDEAGTLIGSMTQQCILRPKAKKQKHNL
ncbi:acyl-CoA thioesterase II [Talaromyces proteolyticus]|uniref:Acyl-CoA thioesterase II n=1 Tax=Talaromyces proteolyticus TaxID=1131652 RepID=A0AAD4Q2H4_9EURO|nr:acyl-CoA thioesterase II [Talaromyces proteolyticus]KAH8700386.1 acyl-CoA thioesterase II [Talaromyces proteolyticus]